MRTHRLSATLASVVFLTAAAFAADVQKIAPADAAKLVAAGKAVLVDVREPAEWAETGVAQPAVLLAKSDFDGEQKEWKDFLAKVGDKQVILYCRSGGRSGTVAAALAAKGVKTANAGGLKDWTGAGLPVRKVGAKK
ncbi:MAG: rhodanese-like domain-containing protein [Verrucomicrobia bacterium]|nr:rhodanese-like domain-containing protein [Verrucomicrobiota bacterium]